jgi:hypothetical protein
MAPRPTRRLSTDRPERRRPGIKLLLVTVTVCVAVVAAVLVVPRLWAEQPEPLHPPASQPRVSGEATGSSDSSHPAAVAPSQPDTLPSCQGGQGQRVRSAAQLRRALSAARPGARIVLVDGVYRGEFVARRSGRSA